MKYIGLVFLLLVACSKTSVSDAADPACLWKDQGAAEGLQLTAQVVSSCPRSSRAHTIHGYALLRDGRPDDALAELKKALELDSDWDDATKQRVRMFTRELGRPVATEAIAHAREARATPAQAEGEQAAVLLGARTQRPGPRPETPAQEMIAANCPVGVDCRTWSMFQSFWGFAGAVGGVANGNDTMFIPGLGGGGGGTTTRPPPTNNGRNPDVFFIRPVNPPPATLEEENRDCHKRAREQCDQLAPRIAHEWEECLSECDGIPAGEEYDVCHAECDADWEVSVDRLDSDCAKLHDKCVEYVAQNGTGRNTAGLLALRNEAAPQATCARLGSGACGMVVGCGWCTSSRTCLSGTAAGPAQGGACEPKGWRYLTTTVVIPPRPTIPNNR